MFEREFEKFRGGPTQTPNDRVHVTIDKRNVIFLNSNAYRLLCKPPAVYLYFSRASDVIAIEPVSSTRLADSFPVVEKTGTGFRIQAAPFCKHFNIKLDTTERFVSPEIRDNKMYLKLSETVTTRRGVHRRRKR